MLMLPIRIEIDPVLEHNDFLGQQFPFLCRWGIVNRSSSQYYNAGSSSLVVRYIDNANVLSNLP
jgi:hypothetical protein